MREQVFQFLKLVVFIFVTPVLVAVSMGFCRQISAMAADHRYYLISGGVVYLVLHLFVFEPKWIYDFGHKVTAQLFSFFAPLTRATPYILPVYTVLILILYFIAAVFLSGADRWNNTCLFLVGMTFTMHMIFSARNLREGKTESIPSDYFLSMAGTYLANLILMAALFDLILPHFSFPEFFQTAFKISRFVYRFMFHQLFFS